MSWAPARGHALAEMHQPLPCSPPVRGTSCRPRRGPQSGCGLGPSPTPLTLPHSLPPIARTTGYFESSDDPRVHLEICGRSNKNKGAMQKGGKTEQAAYGLLISGSEVRALLGSPFLILCYQTVAGDQLKGRPLLFCELVCQCANTNRRVLSRSR